MASDLGSANTSSSTSAVTPAAKNTSSSAVNTTANNTSSSKDANPTNLTTNSNAPSNRGGANGVASTDGSRTSAKVDSDTRHDEGRSNGVKKEHGRSRSRSPGPDRALTSREYRDRDQLRSSPAGSSARDNRSPRTRSPRGRHSPARRSSPRAPLRSPRQSHSPRGPRHSPRGSRHSPRGDHYRGVGHHRSGSASESDRYYRPSSRRGPPEPRREPSRDRGRHNDRYRDYRDRDREPAREPRRSRSPRPRRGSPRRTSPAHSPVPADTTDRRTLFVQQLAARVNESQLQKFFEENVGPVVAATIVSDRINKRSKGVGYVEMRNAEDVQRAIDMTGQRLAGMPLIVSLSEAEKNRQARPAATNAASAGAPFHRLYVGNIHFSVSDDDLKEVFEAYGEVEYVSLQRDELGRSRGYGFVQYRNPEDAKEALDKMNNFELASRALRVGLGNDKTHDAAQAKVAPQSQASSFSGAGGRGVHAGGSSNYERASQRESEKISGASALDDADVAGMNPHAYDRYSLMQKLAGSEASHLAGQSKGPTVAAATGSSAPGRTPQTPRDEPSRCIRIMNAFSAQEEDEQDPSRAWVKEIEEDVGDRFDSDIGGVIHVKVDANSDGFIYVKFRNVQHAKQAYQSFQGIQFNGRHISIQYVAEGLYRTLWPNAP